MSHDLHSILEKLNLIESGITPVSTKHGLNKQQKSVPELPALFKAKPISVLNAKTDPEHPMAGYAVGCEEDINESTAELKSALAAKYHELAPSIERHRDSYLANQLYDALEEIAIEHGAEKEFSRMCNAARNSAHMDYDTNPGGFENWFWYLPFADDAVEECGDINLAEARAVSEEVTPDMLDKVKASFSDYLKGLEDSIKQDKDLIAKKKQDLDLKKKELKDLDLQQKAQDKAKKELEKTQQVDEGLSDLEVGDRICVVGSNEHQGDFGEVVEFAPSGKFVVVRLDNGDETSMHVSDVEFHDDQEDWNDDENIDIDINKHGIDPEGEYEEELDEDPTQEYSGGEAASSMTNPTYSESAPVQRFAFEDGSECTVHGDEQQGFEIRRGGKSLPSRFDNLEHAMMALEMFKARQQERAAGESNDYVDEK